jgi:hypothetical protein
MKKMFSLIIGLTLVSSISFADTAATPSDDTSEPTTSSTTNSDANTDATDTPTQTSTPETTEAPATVEAAPEAPVAINCSYKVPKDMSTVDPALIKQWAEYAATQSFQFDPANLKSELTALKACYTDQGWKAFNEALKTSGNLDAIQSNNLKVTSKITGTSNVQDIKNKQWKVSIPMDVSYKNKDKQLLQSLNVDLLVSLQKSGLFGIMQVIAVPKQAADTKES